MKERITVPNTTSMIKPSISNSSQGEEVVGTKDQHDHHITFIGYFCIILGQMSYASMNVYEEKTVKKYKIPPLKAVGFKGIFGVFSMGLLLWPLYFIRVRVRILGFGQLLKVSQYHLCW